MEKYGLVLNNLFEVMPIVKTVNRQINAFIVIINSILIVLRHSLPNQLNQ